MAFAKWKTQATAPVRTAAAYAAAWESERAREYEAVDAIEAHYGFAVDRARLDEAARVLACPVKANPPCWQHGRVLYAVLRYYLAATNACPVALLDIGTAKGFSALVMSWAMIDGGMPGTITSLDVLPVDEPVFRNSVLELDGPLRLREFHAPWPALEYVDFIQANSVDYLRARQERVHFAFVDGRHSEAAVRAEMAELARLQQPGDMVMLDDLQIDGVWRAAYAAPGYAVMPVAASPYRVYGIGTRVC